MSLEFKKSDPSQDVDALLADVQRLLRAHQVLLAENTQLKIVLQEQNQKFIHAQNRLLALTHQLPSLKMGLESNELPPE